MIFAVHTSIGMLKPPAGEPCKSGVSSGLPNSPFDLVWVIGSLIVSIIRKTQTSRL